MRPLSVHLTDFQSFRGDHEIDLSSISCAVLSGPNGAGKSTLAVDGLLWPLFGESRGDLDSIISEGEQVGRVELTFGLGDETYMVSRQRSRKGAGKTTSAFHQLTADGPIVLDGKGERETQDRIESVLHMNAALFRQTALSAQGEAGLFSRAVPSKRKELLGEILDLGAWEKRAQAARGMLTDLSALQHAYGERYAVLTEAAGQADDLRRQLAENEATQAALALEITALEKALAEAQEAKAKLLGDQQADAARRKELADLTERLTALERTITAAQGRLADLDKAVADKAQVETEIAKAEAAQIEAAEVEAKRQEREHLKAEARTLAEKIRALTDLHGAAIRQLETQIAAAKQQHQSRERAWGELIAAARKQAEALTRANCVARGDETMAEGCELIAQAREAREGLPRLEAHLAECQQQIPWAEDEKALAVLQAQSPAADLIAEKAKLKEHFEAIVYDSDAHARLRQAAGKLDSLRDALAKGQAAEAARAEVQAGLDKSRAEASDLGSGRVTLEAALGPARDWVGEVAGFTAEIALAAEKLSLGHQQETKLAADRGQIEEKLRAAEQASKDAEALTLEIAEAERRAKLLRILGNTQDGAFSKSGIPALLIELALPEIEAAANEMLATLSDGRMSLSLRTQRPNAKGELAETLDLIVRDERGERDYSTLSGGEQTRVDLAIRCGLSKSLTERAGARCDVLVIDEPAGLDERGQDELVEYLVKLQPHFGLIELITHIDRLKDMLPTRIEVSKDADGSHAEVITG